MTGARRRRAVGVWARLCLALLICTLAPAPPLAASQAPPTLTAWQRALEGHLTIEWPDTARVQQKRIGDRLILRFSRSLGTDIAPALRNLSNFLDAGRSTADGADLSLALKPGVTSKISLRERRIVAVDFFRDPEEQPTPRIEASAIDGGVRLTMDWPGPTRVESASDVNQLRLTISPAWPVADNDLVDLQQSLSPWFNDLSSSPTGDGATALSFVLEPQVAPSVRSFGPSTTIVDLIRDASALPAPAAGPARHVFIPERRPQTHTTVSVDADDTGPPIPEKRPSLPSRVADTAAIEATDANRADARADRPDALTIAWDQPVGAAIFVRAGHLWAVFDQPDAGLLSPLPPSPAAIGPGAILPADGGTALRFPLTEPVDISVSKTPDGHWQVTPDTRPKPPRSPRVTRGESAESLSISPAPGERIVSVVDPDVGDRLDVLPIRNAGIGQSKRRRFVDLELLPTTQGLAWRPLNDRLLAQAKNDTLVLTSPNGLSLSTIGKDAPSPSSPAVVNAVAPRKSAKNEPPARLADKPAASTAKPDDDDAESTPKPSSYIALAGSGVERSLVGEYRRIRRQAIARAAPENRDEARIDLARLLVAERLATEARTVLSTISDNADIDVALQKQALSGIVALLVGRLPQASSLLLDPKLSEDEEMDVWRAALKSAENRWQAAAGHWQTASGTLDDYPPRLQLDLGLMALQTAIETNDDKMMAKGIRRLMSLPLNPYDKAKVDAMRALKAERAGDLDKARALLAGLTDSPNPTIRTLADFQLAALDLGAAGGDPQVLAALDRRMPLWRGHPNERRMLDQLARRYRDVNALRKALDIWQRLIRLYPEAAYDDELNTKRQEAFMRALANVGEPRIPSNDIYAIYLDFNDLLPDAPQAKTAHRQLAGHLTDLDLLDQAIDILQPLMISAEDDLARAEIALTVASLMLDLDRPAPAIAILKETGSAGSLPAALDEERRIIAAQALASLGRSDDALRRLRDLRTKSAQRLRADILWEERNWPRLAAVIDSYFADVDPASPLTERDQELVLWLAMARQRDGAADKLAALRERFRPLLLDSDHLEAFDVATQSPPSADNIRSVLDATERQLTELQRFRRAESASP